MSVGAPITTELTPTPAPVVVTSGLAGVLNSTTLIALVTIVGLIVLLAMGKVDQTAAVGGILTLAGLHGGAAVVTNAVSK